MKRTLFLTLAMAACYSVAGEPVTYTSDSFATAFKDADNGVVYDGNGFFAVQSTAATTVDLTINLDSLYSYAQGHDYLQSYMLQYKSNFNNYGLADARTQDSDGSTYSPSITGWIGSSAWNNVTPISYSTLSTYADSSKNVTLTITNSSTSGVSVSVGKTNLYSASDLSFPEHTETQGYYINLNYVTGITLHTESTLDVSTYELPPDYSKPFETQRADGSGIGRVMFLGDSITHGYGNQSHRWQFFKMLVDNGIENEIVGPRSGYHTGFSGLDDRDKFSSAYGGVTFNNNHLAQSSGRTHNIISGSVSYTVNGVSYGTGVNYGGHSTASAGESYDCDTFICMMGTNDLLSDIGTNAAATEYTKQMQKMLGGTVSLDSTANTRSWQADPNHLGTMGIIVSDVVNSDKDTFYVMSVPVWGSKNGKHGNDDTCRAAVEQYNVLLKQWVDYWNTDASDATQGKVVYVESNRGLVDVTASKFIAPDAFMHASDGLHPSEQGALIIAGNLAQTMGIGGRTAGLERRGTTDWESATVGTISAGATTVLVGENAFTMNNGYTIDFSASFGNGETEGWLAADNALSISLGDGTNSGTLNLSEGYIMWGSDVLFCTDNSQLSAEGNLRIAWHNGNADDNVLKGYYVWLGDMLIGQGLEASSGQGLNGILLSATGSDGSITGLTWTDTAYAPTTLGKNSSEHAYIASQDSAAVSGAVQNSYIVLPNTPAGGHDNAQAVVSSGVDYSGITGQAVSGGACLVTDALSESSSYVVSSTAGWIGLTNNKPTGAVNAQLIGTAVNAIFGTMNNADAGSLTLEVTTDGVIQGKGQKYSPSSDVAIAGGFATNNETTKQHAKADAFNVYVNGGTVNGNIIGGGASGPVTIDSVSLNINSGVVDGTIYGGAMGDADSTVGSAVIRVNGGRLSGDIVAGGNGGTVGNAEVIISGGVIKGSITKGSANRMEDAETSVTVVGNKASIGGNIEADRVTLKDVSVSGYADGFDRYFGTITSPVVVLDNVQNNVLATLNGVESLSAVNGTIAEITMEDSLSLLSLELGADSSLGIFRGTDHTVSTETETTVTVTDVLNVRGSGAVLNANLVMADGSELNLFGNSLQLGSSLTLGGVVLDKTTVEMVTALKPGVSLTLFTGVDELIIANESQSGAMSADASIAFSNSELANGYRLVYEGSTSGTVRITAAAVPEPTSSMLGLVGLVALTFRRRRS